VPNHYYTQLKSNRNFGIEVVQSLIYLYNKQVWLVGDHLLLRDFEPNGVIIMNVCVFITVAMAM
jgi:hypothetical protein